MSEHLVTASTPENSGFAKETPVIQSDEQVIVETLNPPEVLQETTIERGKRVTEARNGVAEAIESPSKRLSHKELQRARDEAWEQRKVDTRIRQQEALEAWRKEHPPLTPEKREALPEQASQHSARERKVTHSLELQLDTEELHAKLGKPGLGRLLHPFRNARILFTVAKRIRAGEYNPNFKQAGPLRTRDGLIDPFTEADDPLAQARYRRMTEKREAEERVKLVNPFED